IVLRNALKTWLAADPPKLTLPLRTLPDAAAALRANAALNPRAAAASAADAAGKAMDLRPPTASAPPPPYRGAPTAGQPVAAPSITPDMAPHEIGKVLLNETDAALARQTLLQAASLPDHAAAGQADASGPRWLFEVPFATPQGSTVAQFEIPRDGRHAPQEGIKAAWRARFSLDIEPIGPVHAQIALTGARAAVTLWAERPETSTQLRDNAPKLTEA